MKTISVGELRQNPTAMLREVASGETYVITRHGREVGRIAPPGAPGLGLIAAKRRGERPDTTHLPAVTPRTAATIDELVADLKGEW